MKEQDVSGEELNENPEEAGAFPEQPIGPIPWEPIPYPWFTPPASGRYEALELASPLQPKPLPSPSPFPWPWPVKLGRHELRLDVDGRYPQMVASGTTRGTLIHRPHWIADLVATGRNSWEGDIWYREGPFSYTHVEITVVRSWVASNRRATVTFSGGGFADRVRTYNYKSQYYHPVDFEIDCSEGELATTAIKTHDHPNRPATLPSETLSVQTVYRRAGFDVTTSPGGVVPLVGAGADALWSDLELHDAMQVYWSKFAAKAQWAMWVFFASLHVAEPPWIPDPDDLGGIMFDDIGPNHRQGTAIFNDSFICNPPAGDAEPDAWVRRMIFWTACHEMGHCFNLAHSWQKSLGTPWIPLANEPEARSFMNYPFRVAGGQSAFFADFEFRFSDGELLFMRHAPERFVQMGNADWFDHHGFQEASLSPEPAFTLELRVNRDAALYEFMEPVRTELKLTNISGEPQVVDKDLLSKSDAMTVIIKKDGKAARQYAPYAQYCRLPTKTVLWPDKSLYETLSISAGRNGWDLAEPGYYTVQVALHLEQEDIVSNALRLRVAPPRSYDEDYLAQDFFSDEVGRILTFGGSRFFRQGNETLREVTAKLSERRVALHASWALGNEVARDYKELVEDPAEARKRLGFRKQPAQPEEARQLLAAALTAQADTAIETFAHVEYRQRVDSYSRWLADQGAFDAATESQDTLYNAMSKREVRGRPILDTVVREVERQRDRYAAKA